MESSVEDSIIFVQMSALKEALEQRFGSHRVSTIPTEEGEVSLLALDLELRSPVTLIMTDGLSDYKMPVPEKLAGYEFNELYFCLPSYWEWEDLENPNMNWIFPWIKRLAKHVVDKQTWFGHGHTMPCGKEMESLSPKMKQNHFILMNPMLCSLELEPIKLGDKSVNFLAITPIFPDEMDYKQGKGTFKLIRKFEQHGISELLDDFRSTVLRSKWRLRR